MRPMRWHSLLPDDTGGGPHAVARHPGSPVECPARPRRLDACPLRIRRSSWWGCTALPYTPTTDPRIARPPRSRRVAPTIVGEPVRTSCSQPAYHAPADHTVLATRLGNLVSTSTSPPRTGELLGYIAAPGGVLALPSRPHRARTTRTPCSRGLETPARERRRPSAANGEPRRRRPTRAGRETPRTCAASLGLSTVVASAIGYRCDGTNPVAFSFGARTPPDVTTYDPTVPRRPPRLCEPLGIYTAFPPRDLVRRYRDRTGAHPCCPACSLAVAPRPLNQRDRRRSDA